MRIYISGPISNTNDYMERFEKAQKLLEKRGHTVVNPALINSNLPKDTTYDEYMFMSFNLLDLCKGIYLLKGYENSSGALEELEHARLKRLFVYMEY